MEVGTKQSKTAVNAGAKPADSMDTSIAGSYEDLGGPTPENYKPDDDSAKLKTPGGTLKGVKDVVTKGAKAAEPMKGIKEDEILDDEETIEEEETSTEEVVAEQEEVEEVDIEEDVNALLGGEELSEEFREKAKIIFEAALKSKVAEVTESLEQKYAAKLDEQVAEAK
ncbi:MAG: T4 prohead core scaffold protein, partial [Gammaproteobacteria bacterium]